MDFCAVEHHGYDNFCYPLDRDNLKISIKTGFDVDEVFLIYGDPFSHGILGGGEGWKGERVKMNHPLALENGLWWSLTVTPPFKRCRYYFELFSGGEKIFYLENGFKTEEDLKDPVLMLGCFIFPWMNQNDIAIPPAWPEDTVWYQIFPSRFARGKNSPADSSLLPWGTADQKVENKDHFGGNIAGMIERLDYLKELGITGIYLNPLNEAESQHKYDTTDYMKIDPEFGSNKEMRQFVDAAHKKGIRIMVDGVFNHTGKNFFAWQDVLKNKEKSKYADWYMIHDFNFNPEGNNAHEGKYFSFGFVDGMPKLDTNNPEVQAYLLDVCSFWVKEYDIDGLRLDVANEISHDFCIALQKKMRALKKDFYIVGEIWHNSLPWLRGNEYDAVMNYPLRLAITDFFEKKSRNAMWLEKQINGCMSMYFSQVNRVQFNLLDSHDTMRIINKTGNKNLAKQELAFMFAMTGSCCIYYGTEIFLEGSYDPDCRRCMPWPEIESGKYSDDMEFIKALIALRKNHPAMKSEAVEFVPCNDSCGALCNDAAQNQRFVRIRKECSTEKLELVFNCGSGSCSVGIPSGAEILLQIGFNGTELAPDGFVIMGMTVPEL